MADKAEQRSLIEPHGGELVNRLVPPEQQRAALEEAGRLLDFSAMLTWYQPIWTRI